MVLDSFNIGRLKDLDVRKTPQNAMESSASVPRSPPQPKPMDLNATFAVTSEPKTKMASPSTPQYPSAPISNYATVRDNTCLPKSVMNPQVRPSGNSFSLHSVSHFMDDIESCCEETANARSQDALPCNLTNKSAVILPSVPPNGEKSTISLPDEPTGHNNTPSFALLDNKSFAVSPNNIETATSRSFDWTDVSKADETAIATNLTPNLANEAIRVTPKSDPHAASVAKGSMGVVLTCHDRLETVLTPKNIIEYQSVGNLGSPTSASNGKRVESLSKQAPSMTTSPRNGSRSFTTSAPQNDGKNSCATETIESLNERLTTSCGLGTQTLTKPPSKQTGDHFSAGSTNEKASVNSVDLANSNETQGSAGPDPTFNIAKDATESPARPNRLDLLKTETETTTSGAKPKSEQHSKSTTRPRNGSMALSVAQNRMKSDLSVSKRNTDSPTKPKILTKSPSRDKVDKKLFRYSIGSSPGPALIKNDDGTFGPISTVVLPSKPKTPTKSLSVDKTDKRLSRSSTEMTSATQNKMVDKASVPKTSMASPTKARTVLKSPSISSLDKKSNESSKIPQTKMVDTDLSPTKPKTLPKSPPVDKVAVKKSLRKEKSSLGEASPGAAAERRPSLKPPWRGGAWTPSRSQTNLSLAQSGFIRRSESSMSVNAGLRSRAGLIRPATSLPHIPKSSSSRPCLLVALRPTNLQQERERFFQSEFTYEPQFEYEEAEISAVLDKYKEGSDLFIQQAVGIMEVVLRKYGSYENFEEATGGSVLPKSQVWAAVRKYLHKEGCVGEVVVRLSDELLSQAVMVVENCRPTLTINLAGARQLWLEGMLRHEIGTHYLRGVNNSLQPWSSAERRKALGLKGANPTEEGLASVHSVLLRKHPHLWRAALLYYTVLHARAMSFSQLFHHIGRFVHSPDVRWEYCLRAKRGQTDTSKPGCFSKDQVYLDGILRILRHRRTIDFQLLTALGKVSFEDVERLRPLASLSRTRIPHFMNDTDKYQAQLDHILQTNELRDEELQRLMP